MVTIHREAGLRFVIFTDDHEPVHVHVTGAGTAKIALMSTDGQPQLVTNEGFKANDLRRAMSIAIELQDQFLERWSEIHG